jgi:uncharacterized membrane protein
VNSSLRASWLEIKASYWFIPTLLTAFSFGLALLSVHLDRLWGAEWLERYSWYEASRPEGARAQLTVIASAMIAVSSTVFAITIAAVAYASGSYGPRLLNNFMNDRGNQVSLGVFIATFVYNLLVLRAVRNPEDPAIPSESAAEAATAFVPQLSMAISSASVLIAVGVLVYFLHHIPASIRINTVLGGIGRHLIADIKKRYPAGGGETEPEPPEPGTPVAARSVGYVEIVDFARLDRLAAEHGLVLSLAVRTGDFIHPHLPVLFVSGGTAGKAVAGELLGCFSLGDSRTPTQDLEFLIDELVEIGVRALSPGINDPFTAITSLHWLAAALSRLADRDLCEGPEQESYDRGRVRPLPDDFGHYLRRSFGGMRAPCASYWTAAVMFLDSLAGIAIGASSDARRRLLIEEAHLLLAQAETELKGPALEAVRARYAETLEKIKAMVGRSPA